MLHGRKIGRDLGTPTVNQAIPKDFVLPKFGVYASRVFFNNKKYYGVTNVGIKPTVGSPDVLAETWIPDYCGADFYGKIINVELIKFLRPERKFSGLDELKRAIIKNGHEAKEYFAKNGL